MDAILEELKKYAQHYNFEGWQQMTALQLLKRLYAECSEAKGEVIRLQGKLFSLQEEYKQSKEYDDELHCG